MTAIGEFQDGKTGAGHVQARTVRPRGYVQSMATDPRWRRRGYAQAVVKALLDRFAAAGVRQVGLHASAAGVPLYRSCGFRDPRYPELVWRAPR